MGRIVCLRHEDEDDFGVAPGAFADGGLEMAVVDAWREPMPSLDGVDALAVFGGSMSSLDVEGFPFLREERDLIRRAVEAELPVLGVCLGAQIAALALGGDVFLAPRRELGFLPLRPTEEGLADPLLAVFGTEGPAFQWHEDAIAAPPDATLLATTEEGGVQAYRLGSLMAVQFHPEVTFGELESWVRAVGPKLAPAWEREPEELLAEVRAGIEDHNRRGRAFLRAFAASVAARSARARIA
jgi:GMP synthase (glutamine-hydrolysing)